MASQKPKPVGDKKIKNKQKNVKRLSKKDTSKPKKIVSQKQNENLSKLNKKGLNDISIKKKELIHADLLEEQKNSKVESKAKANILHDKLKKLKTEPEKKKIEKKVLIKKEIADDKKQTNLKVKSKAKTDKPQKLNTEPEKKKVEKKVSIKKKIVDEKVNLLPVSNSNNKPTLKKNKNKSLKSKSSNDFAVKENVNLSNKLSTKIIKPDKLNLKLKSNKQLKIKPASTENSDTKPSATASQEKKLANSVNKEIKSIKTKKRKHSELIEESKSENKVEPNLKRKTILKFVQALYEVIESEEKQKKSLFSSEKTPILLLISSVKVPKAPNHQARIALPHSLVSSNDDVALFVSDLKRGRRVNYENTVQHYEDLLEQHGVTRIKTIIPVNQVKTEYSQYEMKRKLLGSYDHFLVDGRVAGIMSHLLGKIFKKKRKLPTSIHMNKDLKKEIDFALSKTSLQIHSRGNSFNVEVGNSSMQASEVVDNIIAVSEALNEHFPGGWANVRSLRIKTPLGIAIPIYITLKNKNDVPTPVQKPKRPKAYEVVEGELSTFTSNVKVFVAPDGAVRVQKMEPDSDNDSKASEDEEAEEN